MEHTGAGLLHDLRIVSILFSGEISYGSYHLLRRCLRYEVAISEIVDLDILYIVAIGHVHLAVDRGLAAVVASVRRGGSHRRLIIVGLNWRHVDMLNSLSRLKLGVDTCGGRSLE